MNVEPSRHSRNQPVGNGRAHGNDRVYRPLGLSCRQASSAVDLVILQGIRLNRSHVLRYRLSLSRFWFDIRIHFLRISAGVGSFNLSAHVCALDLVVYKSRITPTFCNPKSAQRHEAARAKIPG